MDVALFFLDAMALLALVIFSVILISEWRGVKQRPSDGKIRAWIMVFWIILGLYSFIQIPRGEEKIYYRVGEIAAVLNCWALFAPMFIQHRFGQILNVVTFVTILEIALAALVQSSLMGEINLVILVLASVSSFSLMIYENGNGIRSKLKQRSEIVINLTGMALLFLVAALTSNYILGGVVAIVWYIGLNVLGEKIPLIGRWLNGEWGSRPANNN